MYDRSFPRKYPVTTALALVLVLIFLVQSAAGHFGGSEEILLRGVLFAPVIQNEHQYYRLVTAMFLHFGAEHLGSNLLVLLALGPYVEHAYGKVRYLLIYLLSGIAGNLLTLAVDLLTGNLAFSAGASGAVCGLLGVFFVFALAGNAQLRRTFPIRRVLLAAALMLLPGLADSGVNFHAHLGGLVCGFVTAWLLRDR